MEKWFHNRHTLTSDTQRQYLVHLYVVCSLRRVYTLSFEIDLRALVLAPSRRAPAAPASWLFYTRCRHSAATNHRIRNVVSSPISSHSTPSNPDPPVPHPPVGFRCRFRVARLESDTLIGLIACHDSGRFGQNLDCSNAWNLFSGQHRWLR
jgi:hypothetical protein